ncbi:MAG: response regulator [Planctomycetaceae bacterium]|jgi:two-component system chemotaxis response regulator CheY|nr:response regulator [Planctomycetaceae bacterium]
MPAEITNKLVNDSILPSQKIKEILPPSPNALIVDDSVPTRRIFRTILEELGFTVNEAVNGKVALEKLKEQLPETMIIFSDISMPVMDGFEFCFRLMQEQWYDGTPFVLVSTESDAKNVIKGLKLGADDFLPKPFDKEIVSLVLLRILQ